MEPLRTCFRMILEMSITGLLVFLLLLLARLLLKRAPRRLTCLLWLALLFRLLCPVSFVSPFSLVGTGTALSTDSGTVSYFPSEAIPMQGIPSATVANPAGSVPTAPSPPAPPSADWFRSNGASVLAVIWLSGTVLMLIRGGISYLRLKRRLRTAVQLEDRLYETDRVPTPLVFGLVRPRIYLPAAGGASAHPAP